jgi:hypothetical protein
MRHGRIGINPVGEEAGAGVRRRFAGESLVVSPTFRRSEGFRGSARAWARRSRMPFGLCFLVVSHDS